MESYFELCMQADGQYFFVARTVTGQSLAESSRYSSRQAALDGVVSLLGLCRREHVACYDRTRRAWHDVSGPG